MLTAVGVIVLAVSNLSLYLLIKKLTRGSIASALSAKGRYEQLNNAETVIEVFAEFFCLDEFF